MQYKILATGSAGNCLLVENCIVLDLGVPFKTIKPFMRDLQLVLLTHQHSDHFNRATIRRLAKERPTLRFGVCEWLVAPLVDCGVEKKNIAVFEYDHEYQVRYFNFTGIRIEPFPLFHDVPNCGYKISLPYREDTARVTEKLLYATDTSKILTEAKGYDYYFIEINYSDEEIHERIEKQILAGAEYIHEYKAMRNHLSKKDALDFIARNADGHSLYVPLHGHVDKEDKHGDSY